MTMAGAGGKGAGTKARQFSPKVEMVRKCPVSPLFIMEYANSNGLNCIFSRICKFNLLELVNLQFGKSKYKENWQFVNMSASC